MDDQQRRFDARERWIWGIGQAIGIAFWCLAFAFMKSVEGLLFLVIANHIINYIVFCCARGWKAMAVALCALVGFIAWAIGLVMWVNAYGGGPDAGMVVLATSIYSFPVLLPFWIAAVVFTRRTMRERRCDGATP